MELVTLIQILADCISLHTDALEKGMNPCVLSPAMSKIVGQTEFLKRKVWIQTVVLYLKIDLVSHLACSEGVG